MQQYFASGQDGEYLVLKETDLHHIKNVMRLLDGDEILVAYDSNIYLCHLDTKEGYKARIVSKLDRATSLSKEVTLIYGMPKNEKFELVLQKATELGVTRIVPLLCERTVIKLDDDKIDKKMERWNKIVKEASEQCHRSSIPTIAKPIKDDELSLYLSTTNICADESKCGLNQKDLFSLLSNEADSVSIIIGPEGGFSKEEFSLFYKLGFKGVSLGNRILRSETAVFYLLSIIGFMDEVKGGQNG